MATKYKILAKINMLAHENILQGFKSLRCVFAENEISSVKCNYQST